MHPDAALQSHIDAGRGFIDVTTAEGDEGGGEFSHLPLRRTPLRVPHGTGAPIDEEAIRLLEHHNPDIEFDWTRILKDPPPEPAVRRERDSRERDRRDRRDSRPMARPRPPDDAAPAAPVSIPAPFRDPQEAAEAAERRAAAHAAVVLDGDEGPAAETSTGADTVLASSGESLAVEHREPLAADHAEYEEYAAASASVGERHELDAPAGPADPREASAVALRLGAEGLVRLRARYAEVMARIGEKPMEEPEREELKLRAERLNPDGWVTADEVGAALEQYEAVFESVRAVVGRYPGQRRRRR